MTTTEHFNSNASLFLPWLLGSQSCEKIFRSARSMTNTFSTMINFSILGLLRRLHRLQIQSNLQAESEVTGIMYPQIQKHKSKDGKNYHANYSLDYVSMDRIGEVVLQANMTAKVSVEDLGMADLLKEHDFWDAIPVPGTESQCDGGDIKDSSPDLDSDNDIEVPMEPLLKSVVPETTIESASDIETDITALSTNDLIDSKIKENLVNLKHSLPQFKRVSKTPIRDFDTN